MAKRTGKTYRMTYAEKVQYHGIEAAKVMHQKIQDQLRDKQSALLLQARDVEAERMADNVAFDKALEEALKSAVAPVANTELPVANTELPVENK